MFHRITVKIGSNVLALPNGQLNTERMAQIVQQLVKLRKEHKEVILVSSGAVASGKGLVDAGPNLDTVQSRQLYAAVGQVHLINTYSNLLNMYDMKCAQILVTKEDFRDRTHYLNLSQCINVLLSKGIIPIINENDAISVTELMFTDNDELSGMMASMMNCSALIILSNVDGLYDRNPADPDATIIREIGSEGVNVSDAIQLLPSKFGRGGMITKYNMARKVAVEGISVFIANGTRDNILLDLLRGNDVPYTHFKPVRKTSQVKKWIAHSDGFAKGSITINDGAVNVLCTPRATSVLPVGVIRIDGEFLKGDIITIKNSGGKKLGVGRAMYDSVKLAERMGKKGEKPIVHYDYLFLEL